MKVEGRAQGDEGRVRRSAEMTARTVGQKQVGLRHRIIHFPTSSGVSERVNEQVSVVERASEASRVEQANEWVVRANEQTDKRVAQYLRLDSWLF